MTTFLCKMLESSSSNIWDGTTVFLPTYPLCQLARLTTLLASLPDDRELWCCRGLFDRNSSYKLMLSKVVVGRASALRIKGPLCTPLSRELKTRLTWFTIWCSTKLLCPFWFIGHRARGKNSMEKNSKINFQYFKETIEENAKMH